MNAIWRKIWRSVKSNFIFTTLLMNSILQKVSVIRKEKREAFICAERNVQEVEQQQAILNEAIDVRLRQFVAEKKELMDLIEQEQANYDSLFVQFNSLCKQLNLSSETLLNE